MSLYDIVKDKNVKPNSLEELDKKWVFIGRNQKFSWLLSELSDKNRYELTDEKYWELCREGYQSSELGHLNYMGYDDILFLLQGGWDFKDGDKYFMTNSEREYLKELPEMVTIYRGVMVQTNKDTNNQLKLNERNIGFSWTLDKQKGEWFGNRFSSLGDCYLLETKVETRLIMYYLNDIFDNCK